MTGERGFRVFNVSKDAFLRHVDFLRLRYKISGPVKRDGHAAFSGISSASELFLDYETTMIPPSKVFFYKAEQDILFFEHSDTVRIKEALPPENGDEIILGIHPCDMNAIFYLDKVFSEDPYYMAVRERTLLVALNCNRAGAHCFCSSLGTGPHLKAESGYDALLTDAGEGYLVEIKSERGRAAFGLEGPEAGPEGRKLKSEKEMEAIESFRKIIDLGGLDAIFIKNQAHPVWSRTAEGRCLSCSNCVMVCPTCFCHDIVDETEMGLAQTRRFRRWDACQDAGFSKVHGGNFRSRREARLRQFVMHKLNYTAQFGTPGTVGCGRCIKWCPTGIDLTEIAREIRRTV